MGKRRSEFIFNVQQTHTQDRRKGIINMKLQCKLISFLKGNQIRALSINAYSARYPWEFHLYYTQVLALIIPLSTNIELVVIITSTLVPKVYLS